MSARRLAAALLASLAAAPAWAGPPYDTDDPVPTDLRHWEIYAFAGGARGGGAFDGSAGLDLNYGAFRNVQLTATLPVDFVRGPGARTGLGDLEFGAKYRFLHDEAAGVSLAAFPRAIVPTSKVGSGRVAFLLPVWGEKDWRRWSVFGGGGYAVNPGLGNRNYWVAGAAVTRAIGKRLAVGAEATHHGRDADDAPAVTTLGLGASYRLRGPFSLLVSAGPSFSGRGGERYHAYAALLIAF